MLVPQEFVAVAVIFPLIVPAEKLVCKVAVPCPEVIVIPVGTVHV